MWDLKPISKEAVPEALEKAERYRYLNEPAEAESICRDILLADPGNQQALIWLILSLSDQIGHGVGANEPREWLMRLDSPYDRAYFGGIIAERTAKWIQRQGSPGSKYSAYERFREAMALYEMADAMRAAGNDDARLRWNTCARILARHPELAPRPEEEMIAVRSE